MSNVVRHLTSEREPHKRDQDHSHLLALPVQQPDIVLSTPCRTLPPWWPSAELEKQQQRREASPAGAWLGQLSYPDPGHSLVRAGLCKESLCLSCIAGPAQKAGGVHCPAYISHAAAYSPSMKLGGHWGVRRLEQLNGLPFLQLLEGSCKAPLRADQGHLTGSNLMCVATPKCQSELAPSVWC